MHEILVCFTKIVSWIWKVRSWCLLKSTISGMACWIRTRTMVTWFHCSSDNRIAASRTKQQTDAGWNPKIIHIGHFTNSCGIRSKFALKRASVKQTILISALLIHLVGGIVHAFGSFGFHNLFMSRSRCGRADDFWKMVLKASRDSMKKFVPHSLFCSQHLQAVYWRSPKALVGRKAIVWVNRTGAQNKRSRDSERHVFFSWNHWNLHAHSRPSSSIATWLTPELNRYAFSHSTLMIIHQNQNKALFRWASNSPTFMPDLCC